MITVNDLMAVLGKGRSNGIHAAELARALGFSPKPNQEELRAFIRSAIDSGALIGSSPRNGYWEIDSVDELDTVLDSLEERAQEICVRRNTLLSNWNGAHPTNQSNQHPKNVN